MPIGNHMTKLSGQSLSGKRIKNVLLVICSLTKKPKKRVDKQSEKMKMERYTSNNWRMKLKYNRIIN